MSFCRVYNSLCPQSRSRSQVEKGGRKGEGKNWLGHNSPFSKPVFHTLLPFHIPDLPFLFFLSFSLTPLYLPSFCLSINFLLSPISHLSPSPLPHFLQPPLFPSSSQSLLLSFPPGTQPDMTHPVPVPVPVPTSSNLPICAPVPCRLSLSSLSTASVMSLNQKTI